MLDLNDTCPFCSTQNARFIAKKEIANPAPFHYKCRNCKQEWLAFSDCKWKLDQSDISVSGLGMGTYSTDF